MIQNGCGPGALVLGYTSAPDQSQRGDTMLPRDVDIYLSHALKKIDWQKIDAQFPDICKACPQFNRPGHDQNDLVCLDCPWFGVLYSHLAASHYRPPRRPGRKPKLPTDDQGRD